MSLLYKYFSSWCNSNQFDVDQVFVSSTGVYKVIKRFLAFYPLQRHIFCIMKSYL